MQSGFARAGSGKMWGFQLQDVVPDIVTMGKPMGASFPTRNALSRTRSPSLAHLLSISLSLSRSL